MVRGVKNGNRKASENQVLLEELAVYDDDKYIKQNIEAHICQILNGMQDPLPTGIFIKSPTAEAINWRGDINTYQHKFRGSKNVEPGILLTSCKMHIVNLSELYVEEVYGDEQGNKKTRIIGTYDPNSYQELKATKKEKIRVRRFFTIIIVDDQKQPMHDGFLTISSHGLQSIGLDQKIKQFLNELSTCFHAFRKDEKSHKMSEAFLSEHIFEATFFSELDGSVDQSWIAKIKEYVHPKSDGSNYPELIGDKKTREFIRENLDKDFAGSIGKVAAVKHLMLSNGQSNLALSALNPLPVAFEDIKQEAQIDEPPY